MAADRPRSYPAPVSLLSGDAGYAVPGCDAGSNGAPRLYPGRVDQSHRGRAGPASHIDEAKLHQTADLVETEDYALSHDILQGMASGAHKALVFGKNELSAHHFHQSLDRFVVAG